MIHKYIVLLIIFGQISFVHASNDSTAILERVQHLENEVEILKPRIQKNEAQNFVLLPTITSLIALVFQLIALCLIYLQVRKMHENNRQQKRLNQHQFCYEIWLRYNETFELRQNLLTNPINLGDMLNKYKSVDKIVVSEEYLNLKKIAGIYVIAGNLIKDKTIEIDVIYEYISVPIELWEKHLPFIEYLRKNYYSKLWSNWDDLAKNENNIWRTK